jgi:hypothetical protein
MKAQHRRLGVESSFMLTSLDEEPAGTPETNWKIAFPLKCVPFCLALTHKAQRGFGTLEDLNHSVCEFLPSTEGRPIAFDINADIAIAEAKDTVIRQFKVSRTTMLLDRTWFSFPFDGGLECGDERGRFRDSNPQASARALSDNATAKSLSERKPRINSPHGAAQPPKVGAGDSVQGGLDLSVRLKASAKLTCPPRNYRC